MTHKIPLLIDTDPGVDDALALLMAFADERHDVVALTIAAGNVGLEYTVRNALKLCDIVGRPDVPVFAGSPDPLLHPPLTLPTCMAVMATATWTCRRRAARPKPSTLRWPSCACRMNTPAN